MKKIYTIQSVGETLQDFMATMSKFSTHVDSKFEAIEKDIKDIKNDLLGRPTRKDLEAFATKKDLEAFATKKDLLTIKDEIIETVNNKMTVELRKSDRKFGTLVDALDEHKVLPTKVTNRIRAMEPFPQTA